MKQQRKQGEEKSAEIPAIILVRIAKALAELEMLEDRKRNERIYELSNYQLN